MSEKKFDDCGRHGNPRRAIILSRCLGCLLALIVLILFVVLIIYLALHPHKPKFYLQDAQVRAFNTSSSGSGSNTLTSNLQFTVLSHNPNDRISILYDNMAGYAVYSGQPITAVCYQPPLYQGHKDNLLLPFQLTGNAVPVASLLLTHLNYDIQSGLVGMNLLINGRVRWKVGLWTSGHYHLNANCFALLGTNGGSLYNGAISLQPGSRCDVNV